MARLKPIPFNDETRALAESLVWFEPAAEILADPIRLMAYAFARATHEQMRTLRSYVSDDELEEALTNAPAGIIDRRSWSYWNARIGRLPIPAFPARQFGQG